VLREQEPGRYHIDEISRDPLPSGHTSRRGGSRNQASGRFGEP
jgi:hypothetical protein